MGGSHKQNEKIVTSHSKPIHEKYSVSKVVYDWSHNVDLMPTINKLCVNSFNGKPNRKNWASHRKDYLCYGNKIFLFHDDLYNPEHSLAIFSRIWQTFDNIHTIHSLTHISFLCVKQIVSRSKSQTHSHIKTPTTFYCIAMSTPKNKKRSRCPYQ